MYIPTYAEVTDLSLLSSFIADHPFGTLITNTQKEINANHYPFLVENSSELILWTHLARSNPQWKSVEKDPQCLIIFTGPHSYISPVYYQNGMNVPTWSYTAVHVNGSAEVVEDFLLQKELMKRLVQHFENKNGTQWNYDLPADQHEKLLKAIVWLKIKVKKIEGKFKLSQNREKADYQLVLNEFSKRQSDNDAELLKYMKLTTPTDFAR